MSTNSFSLKMPLGPELDDAASYLGLFPLDPNAPALQPNQPNGVLPAVGASPGAGGVPGGILPAVGGATGGAPSSAGMPPPPEAGSANAAQMKLQQDTNAYKPFSQLGVGGKIGRAVGYGASALVPHVASMIPETPLGHIAEINKDTEQLKQAQEQETAQRKEQTEGTAVAQRPELAEQKGVVEGQLEQQRTQSAADIAAGKNKTAEDIAGGKEKSAADIAAGKNTTAADIAAGKNKTAEQLAADRQQTAMDVAKGHDLATTDSARIRAASANNPDALTSTMKTMKQQAKATLPQIDKALDETERIANKLGPAEGRWNDFWQGKVGADDPDYAHYKDEIGMVSTAVTLAHARGRMSNELFEHFQKMFDAGKQSPENLIQALNVAKEWLGSYAQMGEQGSASAQPTQAPKGGGNKPTFGEFVTGKKPG